VRRGKFFRLPDGPRDVERLWTAAAPLEPTTRPEWLHPKDLAAYRCMEIPPLTGLSAPEKREFQAELDELTLVGFVVGPAAGSATGQRLFIPTPDLDSAWSIGVYSGSTPFTLSAHPQVRNPILSANDVHDVPASFVADPFMLRVDTTWYMFFEVFNWRSNKGEIGLAVSPDGIDWTYRGIVLAESFHLSYPYVFEWRGDYYMIPESFQAKSIRLYRSPCFPTRWSLLATLLEGPYFVDASVLHHNGLWWLFTEANARLKHDTLRLFSSIELTGPWIEHPASPVVAGDPRAARPAGRVLAFDNRVVRYAQNCRPAYGTDVRAFEITELTRQRYLEKPIGVEPVLAPSGRGWNARGMHHVDPHDWKGQWIAAVDGRAEWVAARGEP
jgi:hypothetical protein